MNRYTSVRAWLARSYAVRRRRLRWQHFGTPVCSFMAAGLLLGALSVNLRAEPRTDGDAGAVAQTGWPLPRIVDVQGLPWDEHPRFGSRSKTFFRVPGGGSFIYSEFPPTWTAEAAAAGLGSHYHLWHEFGYVLKGDFVIHEPVSPYQKNGALYRYIEGTWLDRPAYTLHGGSWTTGGMRSQNACTLILFEEGDGSVVTVGPKGDHFKPDFPGSKPDPYEPDWQSVPQFRRPWIVDSAADLEWEPDAEVAGRFVKWLSDDQKEGFRARLVKIPPGWNAPGAAGKSYHRTANRLLYVVDGAMKVWLYEQPDGAGKAVTLDADTFVLQPARSIWGYGTGPVTERGAVWLEVTYASGFAVGGGRIEQLTKIER